MPSEKFLAMLVKSKAAGASVVVNDDRVERGPEGGSRTAMPTSGAIDRGVSESNTPLVKQRDRKRNRDGGGSDKSLMAVKTGVDSCLQTTTKRSNIGDATMSG